MLSKKLEILMKSYFSASSFNFVLLQTSISDITNCQVPSSTQGVIMMESFLPELTGKHRFSFFAVKRREKM